MCVVMEFKNVLSCVLCVLELFLLLFVINFGYAYEKRSSKTAISSFVIRLIFLLYFWCKFKEMDLLSKYCWFGMSVMVIVINVYICFCFFNKSGSVCGRAALNFSRSTYWMFLLK